MPKPMSREQAERTVDELFTVADTLQDEMREADADAWETVEQFERRTGLDHALVRDIMREEFIQHLMGRRKSK